LVTAVHATHLTPDDIAALGETSAYVCLTPTTERDLADGIGPARALADAGALLALGSDSNAVIDLFEEARAVELDERLRSEKRGHWTAEALLAAATCEGHQSLGWPEVGRISAGFMADFVTVGLGSVRLADAPEDTLLEAAVFCATAADVTDVVVGGRRIVESGRHVMVDDVPGELRRAVRAVIA
jgi:cytosine/adenosine deaminase-related metal-dependent hydrolase